MQGFFGKQQYAVNAPSVLTMKLSNDLCLECSTCAMLFSSPFTVSIMALFLNNNLSDMLMSAPLILFFSFVTNWFRRQKDARTDVCLYTLCPLQACHTGTPQKPCVQEVSCHLRRPALSWSSEVPLSRCIRCAAWSRRTNPWNICPSWPYPETPCGYGCAGCDTPLMGCCPQNLCPCTGPAGLSLWILPAARPHPSVVPRNGSMTLRQGTGFVSPCTPFQGKNASCSGSPNNGTVWLSTLLRTLTSWNRETRLTVQSLFLRIEIFGLQPNAVIDTEFFVNVTKPRIGEEQLEVDAGCP